MRLRLVAALGAAVLTGCVWQVPVAEPAFPVEYPIKHYVFTEDAANLPAWKIEVGEFRDSLRRQYSVEVTSPRLLSDSKEEQFLDRAVDPRQLLWRDPRLFFKTPVLLSWWEVINESGRVQRIYVVASNQSKEADARILAWCANDKLWKPGELDGSAAITIRSASINLGESRYHAHYWQKQIGVKSVVIGTLVLIGLPVWLIARSIRNRREKRLRHEALLKRVAHEPYKPPSIDEPPRL